MQIEVGHAIYSVTNKAGTITASINKAGNQQNVTAGTLTITFTVTTASSPVSIQVNANSTKTSTGYPRVTYSVENLTQQAIAIS